MDYYILNQNGEPERETDVLKWAEWQKNADRHLARDIISGSVISTVFLGLDHSMIAIGPPVLWETMIFGLPDEESYQDRYATRECALEGHALAVRYAKHAFSDK